VVIAKECNIGISGELNARVVHISPDRNLKNDRTPFDKLDWAEPVTIIR